jgi:AmiR/NasT family two-component response regulator
MVLHPNDADGDTLQRELRRSGCEVYGVWPPPRQLPEEAGVLLCLLDDGTRDQFLSPGGHFAAPVVGLVGHDVGDLLGLVRDCAPFALLHKPIVPAQVIPSLFLARQLFQYQGRLLRRVAKLDDTLKSLRNVERAKNILMQTRDLSEHDAYHFMRRQAMEKRLPMSVIASTIIDADRILG